MLFAYFILIGYSLLGIIYYPNIYTLVAFTFIAISCFPFFIAGIYGYDRRPYKIEYPQISKYLLFSGFLIGIFNLYIITKNAGYELYDIFSISGIKAISMASTEIRYNGGSNVNSGSPIILAISLFFVFIAGLKRKENNAINIIILFVPIILYTVLTTEKWPTFLGIMFCFCGCCCSFSYKEIKVVVIKNIKYLLVVFSLMVVSLYLRSGGQQSVFTSITSLFNYVLSPYYGFGYWLVNIHNNFNLGLGYYTFIGPLSYFSSITGVFRDSGVFDENYYV
ncbi:oligosaccharide repeat unit polymerase, partial [Photobacterium lucens]|uniref:oligosaccharide repeat unit polymerase n=1 Tax=Photobacterium lucens TaxID=2562949 RepID=UPI00136BDF04